METVEEQLLTMTLQLSTAGNDETNAEDIVPTQTVPPSLPAQRPFSTNTFAILSTYPLLNIFYYQHNIL